MAEIKTKQQAKQHLLNQNIDPSVVEREQRPELMVPKLALVGMFNTLETFCVAGKNSIMSTVGPLNVQHLALFLNALKKSIALGEVILQEYQAVQEMLANNPDQDDSEQGDEQLAYDSDPEHGDDDDDDDEQTGDEISDEEFNTYSSNSGFKKLN
jgi:hypothetical protein